MAEGTLTAAPYGRKAQREPAVKEVHVLWTPDGLGCDGNTVSTTAATQPSLEDIVMGAIPGLPKVHLQVAQVPWDREAAYRLPVQVWKDVMEHYYPNSAWLGLRRDVFERLYEYKRRRGLPTWEQTLESLLEAQANQPAPVGPGGVTP
jgi:hypothetical protein